MSHNNKQRSFSPNYDSDGAGTHEEVDTDQKVEEIAPELESGVPTNTVMN